MAHNATALNVTDSEEDDIVLTCALWQPAAHAFIITLPLWCVLGVLWVLNVCGWQRHYALDLHRMLIWIPAIETLNCTLSVMHFLLCPWRTPLDKVVGAAWVISSILKEPIMLVCLLLVAKGWCITRQKLSNQRAA